MRLPHAALTMAAPATQLQGPPSSVTSRLLPQSPLFPNTGPSPEPLQDCSPCRNVQRASFAHQGVRCLFRKLPPASGPDASPTLREAPVETGLERASAESR
ncbi:hypothetical protein P7K49_007920 [Saguinus oedipus]|uniref:Uncharacterized protein n=1 Tax=Saguinus oedipus TaxID=9490 RepID=A0ABQ9VW83_SAGOE|nr:hypothetical protein P7K49_007920 [Saguinus oedipus]